MLNVHARGWVHRYISTRWYRPPECLLSDGLYNYKMDMWSAGCVFFEILALFPLFPGRDEKDQMVQIHNVLGTPKVDTLMKLQKVNDPKQLRYTFPEQKGTGLRHHLPHATDSCIDLMMWLLMYDPDQRITARQAVKHPYFRSIRDGEKGRGRDGAAKVRKNAPESTRSQLAMTREKTLERAMEHATVTSTGKYQQFTRAPSNPAMVSSSSKQQSTNAGPTNTTRNAAPQPQSQRVAYGVQQKRSNGGPSVPYGSNSQAQSSYGAQQKMPPLNLQKKKQPMGRRGTC